MFHQRRKILTLQEKEKELRIWKKYICYKQITPKGKKPEEATVNTSPVEIPESQAFFEGRSKMSTYLARRY
jgi:hypothetical protein